MHRCRIDPRSWGAPRLQPAEGEIERLARVLRVQPGETVMVFDGVGWGGTARLRTDPADGSAWLQPLEAPIADPAAAPLPLDLYQAVPKATRMDWLVEKVTELGVASVTPLVTERSVVRPDPQRPGQRLQRWQRIAQQAARQCGLATVPEVALPVSLETALQGIRQRKTAAVYGALTPDALSPRRVLDTLAPLSRLAVFIGPEGDFSPVELDGLRAAGILPVTLGCRVLRVETAAVAAVCLLGYEMRP